MHIYANMNFRNIGKTVTPYFSPDTYQDFVIAQRHLLCIRIYAIDLISEFISINVY